MTSFGNLIAVSLFIIGPALCEDFDPSLVKKCNDECEQSYGLIVLEHRQGNVPIKIAEMSKEFRKPKCSCALNYKEMHRIIDEANLDVNSFRAHETDYWEMTQWLKDHGFKLRISLEVCNRECLQEGGYIQKKKPRKSEHKETMSGGDGKEKSHTNSPGNKGRKVMFQHGNGEAESRLHKCGHEEIGKDGNQQEESRHVPLKTGHLKNIKDGKGECECRYRDDFYVFLEHAGCDVAAFKERKDNSTEARDWLRANGFSVSVTQAHRHVCEVKDTSDERECEDKCHETQGLIGFKIKRFKKDAYGRRPIATGVDENDPSGTQSLKVVIPKGHFNEPLECNCKINPEVYSYLETLKIDTSAFKKAFFKGGAKGCNWLWRWNIKRVKMHMDVMCPK